MRFLVDECTGPAVASWLRGEGHEVYSAFDEARGASDAELLAKAATEGWILITNDKDFGEHVFRHRQPHRGIVLLRLDDERAKQKIAAIAALLATYSDRLEDNFVVVSESQIRFARTTGQP